MTAFLNRRGIHYIATRYGWPSLRAKAFDERFKSGRWTFESNEHIGALLRSYLKGGNLLLAGCGSASCLKSLTDKDCNSVIGVDISAIALVKARENAKHLGSHFFSRMDMSQLTGIPSHYDVIYFPESLYYLSRLDQLALLKRLRPALSNRGVFMVSAGVYHDSMFDMLNDNFTLTHTEQHDNQGTVVFK